MDFYNLAKLHYSRQHLEREVGGGEGKCLERLFIFLEGSVLARTPVEEVSDLFWIISCAAEWRKKVALVFSTTCAGVSRI